MELITEEEWKELNNYVIEVELKDSKIYNFFNLFKCKEEFK